MTAPVNKKFLQEFDEKEKKSKSSCLGLLRGRKIKHCVDNSQIVRSRAMDDLRVCNNPIFKSDNIIFT